MERAGTLLWWGLLIACALGLWAAHATMKGGGPGEGPPFGEEFSGRFAVGAARSLGAAGSENILDGMRLDTLAPASRLRMVPVVAEVAGAERAREMLESLREAAPGADFDAYWRIYGEDAAPPSDEGFARRNGWFGRLALSRGLPDDSPPRRTVLGEARRTFLGSALGLLGVTGALVAGLALLPVGLSALSRGRLRFAYRTPARAPLDRVWIETVTLLLAGVIATGFLGPWSMWPLALVPLWPLARGIPLGEWREGLGLSRGRGIAREIGAGLVGYLAGMPIFAAGFFASLLLSRLIGEPLSHPAIEEGAERGLALVHLFLAAAAWAPLVEETCFRGAFQRYLRARMPRVAAAACVGLLFAFVHPQGLAAIPALMAIGGWFAILREWRGTIVPCIAAHAVHNLALVSLAIAVL